MEITRLQPDGLVVSPAFSQVAVVPAGATTIYVGGQNGVDAEGKSLEEVATPLAMRRTGTRAEGARFSSY